MTKAISSYPQDDKIRVVQRRLAGRERGIGFLAAVDAVYSHYPKNTTLVSAAKLATTGKEKRYA